MKLRELLSVIISLLLLTLFTSLLADFSNPYKINGDYSWVYNSGKIPIRKQGDTIHLTYNIRDYQDYDDFESIRYVRLSPILPELPDYWEVSSLPIDPLIFWRMPEGNPVLEVMSDGRAFVFYPKYDGQINDWHLRRAEISPEMNLVGIDIVSPFVYRTANIVNDDDNLHLLFKYGLEKPISYYHLFYDKMTPIDGVEGNIRFFGQDVIYGHFHSNTDIWIRQIGGGNNNGWPTFYGLVTTAGTVQVYGGSTYPEYSIFRGGLIEEYYELELPSGATQIRQNGIRPFGSNESDDRIFFVTIEGTSFTSMVGEIVLNPPQGMTIYSNYPPYGAVGDSIGWNYITIPDTLWTDGPSGIVDNSSVWVPGELWISGNVGGVQTWGSSHNIYIKDDLTYQKTVVGEPPDGGSDNQYPINTTDMLALVSEQKIMIQYGYRDPTDGMRYKPNCDDIYIYGYLFALGDGEGDTVGDGIHHLDGIFSYQYQFPKGSTPDQIYQDQFYDKIDLHLRKYPTSVFHPWPPGLDYPWYNPLWPEPGPIFDPGAPYTTTIPNPHGVPTVTYLRGTINLYGGFASRRVGYIRRSGNPDFDTGIWDPANYLFGRHTNQPTGYDKNYVYDWRFEYWYPPDIPNYTIPTSIENTAFHYWRQNEGEDEFIPVLTTDLINFRDNLLLDVYNNRVAILMSNRLLLSDETGGNFQEYQLDISSDGVLDMIHAPEGVYFLTQNRLQLFDTSSYLLQTIDERSLYNSEQAIAIDGGNIIWAASTDLETIQFNIYNPPGELLEQYNWSHGLERDIDPELADYNGSISLVAEENELSVIVYIALQNDNGSLDRGDIYLARGTLEYQGVGSSIIDKNFSLRHYPNPVYWGKENRNLPVNISFSLPSTTPVRIDIYNIRGQKIKSLVNSKFQQGEYTLHWDGTDNNHKPVARGIYFYKLETDNHQLVRKMLLLN